MSDRFYMQKCEFAKVSPADLIYAERHPDSPEAIALNKKILKKLASGTKGATSTVKRVLKADAIQDLLRVIGVESYKAEGLDKLTVADIIALKDAIASPYGFVNRPSPNKGLKKVYVTYLKEQVSQEVDFNRATLDSLKKLIEALGI